MEAAVKMSYNWEEVSHALTTLPPIAERYQALFFAKTTAPTPDDFKSLLVSALQVEKSTLMRHEICYVLGQSGHMGAVKILQEVMHDSSEDEVTRHEAAEALAALDAEGLADDLRRYATSREQLPLLADTCELALDGLAQKNDARMCACLDSEKVAGGRFVTKDPAKGNPDATLEDVPALSATLTDPSAKLFARYEAMFTLRNLGAGPASAALAQALLSDRTSSCLRHELAFVLAQLEDEATADALVAKLADVSEHAVVRHEAAIALSVMGGAEVAKPALIKHLEDPDPMVSESCAASLSTMAYWQAWEDAEARIMNQKAASS